MLYFPLTVLAYIFPPPNKVKLWINSAFCSLTSTFASYPIQYRIYHKFTCVWVMYLYFNMHITSLDLP